jgi:uncharacterized surface protein with fasciclin (FAS1) repeats
MKKLLSIVLATSLFFVSCSDKNKKEVFESPSMMSFLQSQPSLSMYVQALEKAGLQSYVNGPGPFTFFAPTNEAFLNARITQDSLNRMSPGAINYLLQYHIINSLVTSKDLLGAQFSFSRGTSIGNTGNTQVFLGNGTTADSSYINGTHIISRDNMISNGVVHVINKFQVPPALVGNVQSVLTNTGQHSLFIAALMRAGRWTALAGTGPFTVLAPTNTAMSSSGYTLASINAAPVARMDSLVRYHFFSGSRLFTNDLGNRVSPQTALGVNRTVQSSGNGTMIKGRSNPAAINIVQANMLANNGVVHSINGVLIY